MFSNLIESSSHSHELRRRGSFFLYTIAAYALLFVITGVASIYAYDAQMEDQNLEISILTFSPELPNEIVRQPDRPRDVRPSNPTNGVVRPTRPILIDTTSNPNNVPRELGVKASVIPPAPRGAVEGPRVTDPPGSGTPNSGESSGPGGDGFINSISTPPPAPTPARVPPPKVVRSPGVLNSEALFLPKPPYPPIAKQIGVQGTVNVQVLLDETGKVISAKAVSGHPLLSHEAVRAALQARFSPTKLGDQAVKVSGVIVYNFVLQR